MTPSRAGVLVAAKPAGRTSFDVVAAVRRALAVKRVGHAGTLDPAAVGVLPILIGEATKLMPYLADADKEYRVTVRFGVTTDTLDLGGHVLATRPVAGLDQPTLAAAAARFVGRILQVPPMFSALHHEGRRLYELAREGVEVERRAREVVVHAIEIEQVADATATLRIVCGKGTYVRVLASDIGQALGFGAAVERLVRTRVGTFTLDAAVAWADIPSGDGRALWARVLPPAAAIPAWPSVHLDDAAATAFVHGQAVPMPAGVEAPGMPPVVETGPGSPRDRRALGDVGGHVGAPHVRVHDRAGRLIGVGELAADGGRVRPLRILHVDRPGTRVLPV